MAKAALLGLLPLVALLLVTELLLAAFGLGDPRERLSLTRGFDPNARYLVPDPELPGGWVTQMHAGTQPEVHIPPKDKRLRVLMFGGSNTQSFPEEYLQQVLAERTTGRGFELVNLGRQGYGSERVRILLEQSMVLQPDILFIYSGHNEFVERGFAMELVAAWDQPWIARQVDRLSRLRTLNVLVAALEPERRQAPTDGPAPEPRQPRGTDFRGLSYAQTLQFYEEYRFNLERMIATAQRHGAQVLLSTVVGNMLLPPVVVNLPRDLPEAEGVRVRKLQAAAVRLIPERLRAGLLQTDASNAPIRLDPRDWAESLGLQAREQRQAAGIGPFEPPVLRRIAAPFDAGPYWREPELWTPAVRTLLPTIAAVLARELSDADRADVEAAAALLRDALAIAPGNSWTLYDLGLCTWLLGADDALACRLLRDAARHDHAPTRGNDVTNGIVRELAAAHPEVLFVDAEEAVRAACPSGLITYELLLDNCHFYIAARPALLDHFVPGLLELGARAGQRGDARAAERGAASR